jgi:hypothetical protein
LAAATEHAARQAERLLRQGHDNIPVGEPQTAALGAHRPASTLIVGGLSNPAWKVEVEGIAVA